MATDPSRPPTDSEERGLLREAREALREAFFLIARQNPLSLPEIKQIDRASARIDAALGEARGTASASEPLDNTQNSEQGAPEGASLDDLHARGLGHIDAVIGLLEGLDIDYPTGKVRTTRGNQPGGTIAAALTHAKEVRKALGEASGTARNAPLASSESSPPALFGPLHEWGPATEPGDSADLLRENARLREERDWHKRQRDDAFARTKEVGESLSAKLKAALQANTATQNELTRARAAHLENAELLAKAQGENTRLQAELDAERQQVTDAREQLYETTEAHNALVGLNTPLLGVVNALLLDRGDTRVLRCTGCGHWIFRGDATVIFDGCRFCQPLREALIAYLYRPPAVTGTTSENVAFRNLADRKGDAAPPPPVHCTPMRCRIGLDFGHCEQAGHLAAPAKEGEP